MLVAAQRLMPLLAAHRPLPVGPSTRPAFRRSRLWFGVILLLAVPHVFRMGFGAEGDSAAARPAASGQIVSPASGEEDGGQAPGVHGDASARIRRDLLALFLILVLAKLGGDLMERVRQPAVLGELLFGVVLGNIALLGFGNGHILDRFVGFLREDIVLHALAELGVVLLLFQIGVESSVAEMGRVGLSAFLVALFGVIAPFFLGWGVSSFFLRNCDPMVHVYVGAVLCATSVGITARVLQDIGKLQTKEAKIILGAAVIDDVMGLIVLALVQGGIQAKAAGGALHASAILWIIVKASLFFLGSIVIGVLLSPRLFRLASYLRAKGVLLSLALVICLFFAWLASSIGLAPIVGAFCAGLILEDTSFRELGDFRRHDLDELIAPIVAFLVPVFFVRMGAQVELQTFAHPGVLPFALSLTVVAILGKQVCAFGVREKEVDGLAVGLGMIPRGEVGLIVASYGMSMALAGQPVVNAATYSAIVIMIMVTTLVTPPILSWRMRRRPPTPI